MSTTKSRYARPSVEQLARLYTELGLTCPDIGWLYERDPKTVHWWLRAAGIQTRPRGSHAAVQFKKGERSAFAGHKHKPESIAKVRAATIARGAVPYLRNGQHWLTGQPPESNPRWLGGATPERQKFYRSPEWKAAVRYVWARDDACCRNCGKDWRTVDRKVEPTFHIHHVWTFQIAALRANPAILVLLCRTCHLWVHSNANVTRAWLPQESDSAFPALDDQIDAVEDLAGIGRAERELSMSSLLDPRKQEEVV
jgi:5-methylcytosine-specific restriction endonuclease McrA